METSEKRLDLTRTFVPLAEETDLVVPIDRWVLRQACQQIKLWQQIYPQTLSSKSALIAAGAVYFCGVCKGEKIPLSFLI